MLVFRPVGFTLIIVSLNSELLIVLASIDKLVTNVSTNFYLMTRGNPISYELISDNVTSTSGWKLPSHSDEPLPMALFIHGMGGAFNSSSNYLIGKAILESYREWNLISVDYSKEIQIDYLSAVEKVWPVSHEVASWLLRLIDNGDISPENVTLIGFSLGAHVAGISGYILREENVTIGKIVALDPALPSFESVKEDKRLNKIDADMVTVIHTTGGNLGFAEPLGHIDFYPNGGLDPQPMCISSRLSSIMCSHSSSYRYLAESIETGGFEATQCDDWFEFNEGKCEDNPKIFMNLNLDKSVSGKFYLKTRNKPPFGDLMMSDDPDNVNTVQLSPNNIHSDNNQDVKGSAQSLLYCYSNKYLNIFIILLMIIFTDNCRVMS